MKITKLIDCIAVLVCVLTMSPIVLESSGGEILFGYPRLLVLGLLSSITLLALLFIRVCISGSRI